MGRIGGTAENHEIGIMPAAVSHGDEFAPCRFAWARRRAIELVREETAAERQNLPRRRLADPACPDDLRGRFYDYAGAIWSARIRKGVKDSGRGRAKCIGQAIANLAQGE